MDVVLATLFAVVAGAATALSPCVLPVLPLALAAGSTGGRRRPVGVALGLAWAFTLAAVALTSLLDAAGLPGDAARTPAIVVLAAFGVALLVPPLGAAVEGRLSRLVRRGPAAGRGDGLRSGLVLGVSLGLVYAPCAGPILAAVLAVDAHGLAGARAARTRLRRRRGGGAARDHARGAVCRPAPRAARRAPAAGARRRDGRDRRAAGRRARPRLPGHDRRRPAGRAGQPHRRPRVLGAGGAGARGRRGPRGRPTGRDSACSAPPPSSPARSAGSTRRAGGRSRCARCAAGSCSWTSGPTRASTACARFPTCGRGTRATAAPA